MIVDLVYFLKCKIIHIFVSVFLFSLNMQLFKDNKRLSIELYLKCIEAFGKQLIKNKITMKKILFSLVLSLLMFASNIFGQSSYSDDKIEVTTEVKELKDKTNDRFYSYYKFSIENKTNETIKIEVDFIYSDGTTTRKRSEGDENLVFTLDPNETIEGDLEELYALTLFKEFNKGNSGKKASDVVYELTEINIKHL
jgi:hypothetical protein